jgi:hypothetical protein
MSTYRLNNLLLPRSVALVGPSPREGSVGRAIAGTFSKLTSTVNSGWSTRVMPRSKVFGRPLLRSTGFRARAQAAAEGGAGRLPGYRKSKRKLFRQVALGRFHNQPRLLVCEEQPRGAANLIQVNGVSLWSSNIQLLNEADSAIRMCGHGSAETSARERPIK